MEIKIGDTVTTKSFKQLVFEGYKYVNGMSTDLDWEIIGKSGKYPINKYFVYDDLNKEVVVSEVGEDYFKFSGYPRCFSKDIIKTDTKYDDMVKLEDEMNAFFIAKKYNLWLATCHVRKLTSYINEISNMDYELREEICKSLLEAKHLDAFSKTLDELKRTIDELDKM